MNALILLDNQKLLLKQIDPPKTGKNEVLIDVQVSGIGGSEYLGFNNTGMRPLPNIMGHGITGTTAEKKAYCHLSLNRLRKLYILQKRLCTAVRQLETYWCTSKWRLCSTGCRS